MEPPDEVIELDQLLRYRAQLPRLEKGVEPPEPAPKSLDRPFRTAGEIDQARTEREPLLDMIGTGHGRMPGVKGGGHSHLVSHPLRQLERFMAQGLPAFAGVGHLLEQLCQLAKEAGPKRWVHLPYCGQRVLAEAAHRRGQLAIGDALENQGCTGLEVGP